LLIVIVGSHLLITKEKDNLSRKNVVLCVTMRVFS